MQQETKAEDAARAAASAVSASAGRGSGRNKVISSIPAVVSKGRDCDLKPGCLLVLVSSLEVRDTNCQLLHRFERNEIDEINVTSPYEIAVRQRFIGKPDMCYRILSAKMPEALSVLEMQYKKKIEFTSEFFAFKATPASSPCDKEAANWSEGNVIFLIVNNNLTTEWRQSLGALFQQPDVKTLHPGDVWICLLVYQTCILMSHFTLIASVALL